METAPEADQNGNAISDSIRAICRLVTVRMKANTFKSTVGATKVLTRNPNAEQLSDRLRSAFDDEHGFVIDQRRVAVHAEMVVLRHCVIEQGIADVPGRPAVVFT